MLESFSVFDVDLPGVRIHGRKGGSGPPLLLLHGHPQTHVMWHKIAPDLARDFTVIAADLRGYGDSAKPPGGPNHTSYSKRAMALDQLELMRHFGFERFAVAGHDRGGRVAHRLALDHPASVSRLAVLDIVPTHKLFHSVTREFATVYWHWFFMIQPAPFPETLFANSVDFLLESRFRPLMPHAVTPEAFAEYLRCFRNPETIHAACEDYRAAATIDLEHDAADLDRKVDCPLLALWGARGAMHPLYDLLACWRERASNVTGHPIDAGHFLVEEAPHETLSALRGFFLQ